MTHRGPYSVRSGEVLRMAIEGSTQEVPNTMASVAAQVGTSRSTIPHLVSGKQFTVSEKMAEKIAFVVGKPVGAIFVPTILTDENVDSAGTNEASGAHGE